MMMEVVVWDFLFNFYWNRLLLNDFFDHFFLFYDDRLVMMMDIFYLCVCMFVMRFFHWHMNDNFLFMIALQLGEWERDERKKQR